MASTELLTSGLGEESRRLEWLRRQRHADRRVDRQSVVSNRRVETLAKREDSFADSGGREVGGSHLRYPASNRRVVNPDQQGGAEPGQHLHFQRYLESCAGCQPEVVPSLYPLGGPLLESYLTTTGVAPKSAADVELDLSFSAFRVDEATFRLAVRFAGRVAVAHLVADD
jgi:hypothetical protein